MLLNRGTIRVGIGMPAGANFELVAVDDPYNFASAAELSMFRRPLPATNLTAIPTVMWDGRVTGATINDALKEQANGATQGHAAAPNPLNDVTRQQIVDFEVGLFNAQAYTWNIGHLDSSGAKGRAEILAAQNVTFSTTIPPVTERRWNLFDSWKNSPDPDRRAVYRGQELFNTRPHVKDAAGNPRPEFTCNNCHTVQNFGTDMAGRFFNIVDAVGKPLRRAPDQPLYTFKYIGPPITNAAGVVTTPTGAIVQVTDPGRALITGKWQDMAKFKVPSIRGLAGRAPYFHDGNANTLLDVVKRYEEFQNFEFTPAEEQDLVAFLSAL
jgi:cytochrome c peroxidase